MEEGEIPESEKKRLKRELLEKKMKMEKQQRDEYINLQNTGTNFDIPTISRETAAKAKALIELAKSSQNVPTTSEVAIATNLKNVNPAPFQTENMYMNPAMVDPVTMHAFQQYMTAQFAFMASQQQNPFVAMPNLQQIPAMPNGPAMTNGSFSAFRGNPSYQGMQMPFVPQFTFPPPRGNEQPPNEQTEFH